MSPLQYHHASTVPNSKAADGKPNGSAPAILDIRREKLSISLEDEILRGFVGKAEGERVLPTLLLYSAEGLKLFEDITYLDEYYLTSTEIAILEKHANAMAERVHDGSVVVELGSGYAILVQSAVRWQK
jgi:uncharacterized SAM-dependent methyltransferase